ncbi:MAG TPA: AzlD domain-containing protein [Anaeromyxobacteraceae bacterium]|nr:AzlD domain-containing protein [Anaeromyxobacteraceae bacterium]
MPALVLAGLVTFATRLSFIALLAHARTPPLLARALRLVPYAVLSAIILPELVVRDGAPHLAPDNLRLWAGVVAGGVALVTRNVLFTIAAGMGALWALQALAG